MLESWHPLLWGLLSLTVLLSAFFSSSEMAFISLPRYKVRYLAEGNVAWARTTKRLLEPPDKLLASILLGNNLVNTGAAVLGSLLLVSLLGERWGVPVSILGITALLLVAGEVTPKLLAARYSEQLARLYVRPMEALIWVFSPFANLVGWASSVLSGLARGPRASPSLQMQEEVRAFISAGVAEGSLEREEARMLHRAFRFWDRQVREVMVPRNEIFWVEKGATLTQFLEIYAASGHTRFPVYEESVDNVIGMLSIKDVLLAQSRGGLPPEAVVTELARPPYFTPASKPIGDLLAEMRQAQQPMAMVVDEHGGTAGLVNSQLLVEEIIGRMGDELAQPVKEYEVLDEHTFILDGGLNIDDANEELSLGLPAGHYETVAGLVLNRLGHIPKEGENLTLGALRLVVIEMRGVKVSKVLVNRKPS